MDWPSTFRADLFWRRTSVAQLSIERKVPYTLTGDHWSAEEAYRMGEVQQVAPDAQEALEAGIQIANKIAACAPLGIETTLASAHLTIDHTEEQALSKLDAQFGVLFHTQDFLEGRKAETEGRKPVYQGK